MARAPRTGGERERPWALLIEADPLLRANWLELLAGAGWAVTPEPRLIDALRRTVATPPLLILLGIDPRLPYAQAANGTGELRRRWPDAGLVLLSSHDGYAWHAGLLALAPDEQLPRQLPLATLAMRLPPIRGRVEARRWSGELRGEIEFCDASARLRKRGRQPRLTVTEYLLARALVDAGGAPLTPAALGAAVGLDYDVLGAAAAIRLLRLKLQRAWPGFDAIETVHGHRYRWRRPGLAGGERHP